MKNHTTVAGRPIMTWSLTLRDVSADFIGHYGAVTILDVIGNALRRQMTVSTAHRLWLAQYGPRPVTSPTL